MSWRFRKTFKLLPGVKLNLTRNGLSATIGAAPFSVNVGPKGVYSNLSVPGLGLYNRQRLDSPQPTSGQIPPPSDLGSSSPPPLPAPPSPIKSQGTEIRSASTELLNSQSLDGLRRLLRDAYEERAALTAEIGKADQEASTASAAFYKWERGVFLKYAMKSAFAARAEARATAQAKLTELQEQLRLSTIATQVEIDREQAEPYYRMRDDFTALCESKKIWDVLSRQDANRVVTRTAATESVERAIVPFVLAGCDLIDWDQKVPHLPNRNGGDVYIYPGFLLYRASRQAFALIDCREVVLTYRSRQFIEEEGVPSDSQVVGQVWAKTNKDGSPDRRFRDNYQIPLVVYGSLSFSSPSGLHEEYQCSNAQAAERFSRAWNAFQASFSGAVPTR